MDKLVVWGLVWLILGCQGLQISLDRRSPHLMDRRATCAILVCKEESQTAPNATSGPGDFSDAPSLVAKVSSLKLFKFESSSHTTGGSDNRRRLLVSLTSQHPRLSRVSDGIKVDGVLEANRAFMRLEFSKPEDCRAEFLCQARGEDTEGRDVMSTSRLVQQSEDNKRQGNGLSWGPETVGQVLNLVRQLDSKLAVVGGAIVNWEEEANRLRDKLEHDIDSLKADVNAKGERLEDKIESLGKDSSAQVAGLEDKLESLQRDAETRTNRFEDKLESLRIRLEDKLNSVGISKTDGVVSSRSQVKDIVDIQIERELVSLDAKISSVKDGVSQLGSEVHQHLQALMKQGNLLLTNLTQSLSASPSCEDREDLANELDEGFTSLKKNLQENFREFSLQVNESATETRGLMDGQGLKSSLAELLMPTNCFRGMAPVVSLASSMYNVIQPSRENELVCPVLCDTFTDGGGWIVIQRRVVGNVNFYRGWEDYKKGFGSLDGDFWLGNDNINAITREGVYELRIDMRYKGNSAFAHYDSFSVGDETRNYILHVAHYSGTAGDSLTSHNGKAFSTHDRDNDSHSSHCAVEYVGAWWYGSCHASNLNGQWKAGSNRGPRWNTLSGAEPVSYTEMKVRRAIGKSS